MSDLRGLRERVVASGDAELARIVQNIAVPDPGFDFIGAEDELIAAFFLPRKPNAARMPRLYAFWESLFQQELRWVKPSFEIVPQNLHRTAGNTASTRGALAFASRWGTSRNWSGAVIAAHGGMTFGTVSATWTVPSAAQPANAAAVLSAANGLPGDAWQSSVWIGLDGFRQCSLSLPQMGTVSKVDRDGVEEYYLWVQWWVRGKFFGEVKVTNFPVHANDRISATITVENGTKVSFFAQNMKPGGLSVTVTWNAGVAVKSTAGNVVLTTGDTGDRALTPVEGRHAVWCVERPSVMPTDAEQQAGIKPHETKQFRLPDIGGGVFENALALMRPPGAGANIGVERDLTAARYIRMIDRRDNANPPAIAFLTTPRRPRRGGMEVAQLPPQA